MGKAHAETISHRGRAFVGVAVWRSERASGGDSKPSVIVSRYECGPGQIIVGAGTEYLYGLLVSFWVRTGMLVGSGAIINQIYRCKSNACRCRWMSRASAWSL